VAVDLSIRAAALSQVAARAKKASLFSGSLVDSAQDRHCLALARYACATMLTMLITLRRGDATPKGEARLSKIAHVRCVIPAVATVSVGEQSPRKRPRAEVRGSVAFVELCAKRSHAQSTASLAQVRASGERLPARRLPCSMPRGHQTSTASQAESLLRYLPARFQRASCCVLPQKGKAPRSRRHFRGASRTGNLCKRSGNRSPST
jgi:hypothetical protein